MKTITRLDNNITLYVFEDNEVIDVQEDKTVIGSPATLIISDCNSTNITVHENVTVPEDWKGWKYFFDGTDWTLNSDWIDSTTE
jgi:hypothetical protein